MKNKQRTTCWKDFCDVCAENSKVGRKNTTVLLSLSPSYFTVCKKHFYMFKRTVEWAKDRKTEVSRSEINSKLGREGSKKDKLGMLAKGVDFYVDRGITVNDKFE